jgi:hypothetical protein
MSADVQVTALAQALDTKAQLESLACRGTCCKMHTSTASGSSGRAFIGLQTQPGKVIMLRVQAARGWTAECSH